MQDKQKMLETFYQGALKGGFASLHTGMWSQGIDEDDDEEDEDEEAEYDGEVGGATDRR